MKRLALVLAALLFLPTAGLADYLEVRRNASIYFQPDRTSQALDQIRVGQGSTVNLELASTTLTNGYYRVQLPAGTGTGWIYKSLVRRYRGTAPARPGGTPPAGRRVVASGALAPSSDVMVAHFIDVGQGDAALLEFSCGAVLIDTGGESTPEVKGTANLLAYLDKFFARRTDLRKTIDLVVLSHAHIDHTASVPGLIDRNRGYTFHSIIDNALKTGSGGAAQIMLEDFARRSPPGQRIAYRGIRATDIPGPNGLSDRVIDPVECAGTNPQIRVLWGSQDTNPTWPDKDFTNGNNHSVVVRVDFGQSSFLFSGDLEERAIEDLVSFYQGSNTLDVDVYKVGHHGSANGTTPEFSEVGHRR